MQFILTIMLTLTFGFSMLQCQASTANKPETVKTNTQTANSAANAAANTATGHTDEHADEAPRISLADAKKDFDAGSVIFVDTRAESAYATEHIKGAINIPAGAFETRYKEVPKNKKIIAYCSSPSEHTSARAVQTLKEKGIGNAFALLGGTNAWKQAGYPMEGAEPQK